MAQRTLSMAEATFRHNVEQCRYARHWRCDCRCGGKYHRMEHPAEWMAAQLDQLEEEVYMTYTEE